MESSKNFLLLILPKNKPWIDDTVTPPPPKVETNNQTQESFIINYIGYHLPFYKDNQKGKAFKPPWEPWVIGTSETGKVVGEENEGKLTFIEFLNTSTLMITIKPYYNLIM